MSEITSSSVMTLTHFKYIIYSLCLLGLCGCIAGLFLYSEALSAREAALATGDSVSLRLARFFKVLSQVTFWGGFALIPISIVGYRLCRKWERGEATAILTKMPHSDNSMSVKWPVYLFGCAVFIGISYFCLRRFFDASVIVSQTVGVPLGMMMFFVFAKLSENFESQPGDWDNFG